MKRVIWGVLYIPMLLIGIFNLPDKIGFILLLWPFLGPLLLYTLAKIYGGEGTFMSTLRIWLVSHFTWVLFVLLYPLGIIPPLIFILLVILTGKLLVSKLQIIHRLKMGVALSASILYAIFLYIIYASEFPTIIFYALLITLIYWNRNKLSREAFVLLYRTNLGLKTMDKIALAYPRLLKTIGFFSILFGFLGMLFISGYVLFNVFELLFVPGTAPAVAPLMPGVQIPGSPISLPLVYGILSLFLVVVLHEFSHGVLARVYKIPVKSSGLVLFGPIVGAFVEPDESRLVRAHPKIQLSVLGIGPFSNILSAIIIGFVILPLFISPLTTLFFEPVSVAINSVNEGGAAAKAGIIPSQLLEVNGEKIHSIKEFTSILENSTSDKEMLIITEDGTFSVFPEKGEKHPLIGVTLQEEIGVKPAYASLSFFAWFVVIIARFLLWFVLISIGIGVANLLPIGPVDGGRMLQVGLSMIFAKNESEWLWRWIGMTLFLVIIFILFFPLLKWMLP